VSEPPDPPDSSEPSDRRAGERRQRQRRPTLNPGGQLGHEMPLEYRDPHELAEAGLDEILIFLERARRSMFAGIPNSTRKVAFMLIAADAALVLYLKQHPPQAGAA
jgi:hypothetical protein